MEMAIRLTEEEYKKITPEIYKKIWDRDDLIIHLNTKCEVLAIGVDGFVENKLNNEDQCNLDNNEIEIIIESLITESNEAQEELASDIRRGRDPKYKTNYISKIERLLKRFLDYKKQEDTEEYDEQEWQ